MLFLAAWQWWIYIKCLLCVFWKTCKTCKRYHCHMYIFFIEIQCTVLTKATYHGQFNNSCQAISNHNIDPQFHRYQGPLLLTLTNFNPAWINNNIHFKVWKWKSNFLYTLLGMWLLIQAVKLVKDITVTCIFFLLKYNVQSWQKPLTMVSLTIAARPSATITLTCSSTDIRGLFY